MSKTEWRVVLSPDAEKDFAKIAKWTRKTFGAQQAQTYKITLREALKALHEGPTSSARVGATSSHLAF